MTPNRGNIPPSRRMLTRSMSAQITKGVESDLNICFGGTDVEEFGTYPPRFIVKAKMQYRDGIDRRTGMTGHKVALRMKKGGSRVPFARINSMKNVFDQLLLGDRSESEGSAGSECGYCAMMKKFLYDQDVETPTDGVCTCYESKNNAIASVAKAPSPPLRAVEPKITPMDASMEDFTNAVGPLRCSVVNPYTDMKWVAKGRGAKVAIGAPVGLHCWTLTGSMSHKQVYIFGYEDGKTWKYATIVPAANRLAYKKSSVDPKSINVDNNEERRDERAFYLSEDPRAAGEGAHLVPASNEKLGVIFDDRYRLKISQKDANTHKWKIEIS